MRRPSAKHWLVGLVALQMACQIALLFEALAPFRVVFRTASFGVSLVALVLISAASGKHPARELVIVAIGIVALGIVNPGTSSGLAAVAQLMLYIAIMGPIFWVTRLVVTRQAMARVVVLLWVFHTLSSMVGVLQVYFPGRLQPALSATVRDQQWGGRNLMVQLASGEEVYRPMGLTDAPGGAAMAGLYAVLFGLGMMTTSRRQVAIWAGVAGIPIGLFCIYLTQVRSALVIAGVLTVTLVVVLVSVGQLLAAIRVSAVILGSGILAFIWAVSLGGEQTRDRFSTLLESNPNEVYYRNRGIFFEHTVNELIPNSPLGAGLGRWGVIGSVFGNPNDPLNPPIWVEIQWTAWVVDGGIPLMVVYVMALGVTLWTSIKIARTHPDPWIAGWARVISAYNMAAIALTFTSVPFIGQAGLEFWLLNGTIYAAARTRKLTP